MLNTSRIATFLSVVAGIMSFGSAANAAICDTNADCKGDRVCVQGQCASPANKSGSGTTTPSACAKDTECPGDSVCNQGLCVAPQSGVPAPIPPPPVVEGPRTVPVRFFLPDSGGSFAVRSIDTSEQCAVPCTLQLSPGFQRVRVDGDKSFTAKLVVPNSGGDFGLRYRNSRGLLYSGIGSAVVGVALLTTGLSVMRRSGSCHAGYDESYNRISSNCSTWVPLVSVGSPAIVAGAILILAGINRLELETTSPPADAAPRNHAPQFGVAPTRNGAATTMSMQF